MEEEKESEVALQLEGKETLVDRLRSLIGHRSARAAASAWGLSFSTLNNYLNRGTEPSFGVVQKIALKEDVTLDWLAYGSSDPNGSRSYANSGHDLLSDSRDSSHDLLKATWVLIYESLDKNEIQSLMRLLVRVGVKGILEKFESSASTDEILMHLTKEEKARLLALHESYVNAKKGVSEGSQVGSNLGPQAKEKQAS